MVSIVFLFLFFLFFIKHRGPGILGLVGRFLFFIWNRALLILYAPCIVPYSILFLCLMLSRSFVSHPEKIEIFYVLFSKVGYTSFKKPCSLLDSRPQSFGEAGRFDRKAARKDQEARRGTFSPLPSSRTKDLTIFRRDVCFQSLSQESGWLVFLLDLAFPMMPRGYVYPPVPDKTRPNRDPSTHPSTTLIELTRMCHRRCCCCDAINISIYE